MRRGSAAIFIVALVFAAACGGTTTTSTSGGATATASAGTAGGSPAAGAPSFGQVLTSGKAIEYKATYKLTATGGGAGFSGEQSWFFKPPRARFDFVSTAPSQSGQSGTVS
ncbi:MAG TPA: hypothetical protein VJP45_02825, partial [Candidatus Limnocylindria bacterium]|nr:hypothetical protein [Candidatus Limnocylindria bacterium]